jgi:hypothetical protein
LATGEEDGEQNGRAEQLPQVDKLQNIYLNSAERRVIANSDII